MNRELYTIGHSRHPIGLLTGHLQRHGITMLVDVRSRPASRFAPQFNRAALEGSLAGAGVAYVFLGDELGARSSDPACHRDGKAEYGLIAGMPGFQRGLARVRAMTLGQRVCLMCAERDPLDCHRTMLVGIRLRSSDLALSHILADGELEPHERSENRLLARWRLDQPELWRDHGERLAEAYRRQCDVLAYRVR
jgi:uncharacterized protein (DUF488 family)